LNTFAHQDGAAVASVSNGIETTLWRTTDGIEWIDVTPATVDPGGVWAAGDVWVQGLGFFADETVGDTFNVSSDGVTWTTVAVPREIADFEGRVAVAGNKIIVFGENLLVATFTADLAP
jgi:hypothetical protein